MTLPAKQPMTILQEIVTHASHVAAVKIITNNAEAYDHRSISAMVRRRQVLEQLEAFGLPAYIPEETEHYGGCQVACTVYAKSGDRAGWSDKSLYSVKEVQAYLNSIGDTDSPLEYITGLLCDAGTCGGNPGGAYRKGTYVYQKRGRIIVQSSGGWDC